MGSATKKQRMSDSTPLKDMKIFADRLEKKLDVGLEAGLDEIGKCMPLPLQYAICTNIMTDHNHLETRVHGLENSHERTTRDLAMLKHRMEVHESSPATEQADLLTKMSAKLDAVFARVESLNEQVQEAGGHRPAPQMSRLDVVSMHDLAVALATRLGDGESLELVIANKLLRNIEAAPLVATPGSAASLAEDGAEESEGKKRSREVEDEVEEEPAPRRSSRQPKPTEKHGAFMSWKEVKARKGR